MAAGSANPGGLRSCHDSACVPGAPTKIAEQRSDAAWLAALGSEGPEREAAQRDLRAVLVAGLRRGLGARAEAEIEDFAHEALLLVTRKLGSFRGESRFVTWATAIATRVAWTHLRRARWKDTSLDAWIGARGDEPHAPSHATGRADRALSQERILSALSRAVGSLTERQRAVITAELRGVPQDVLVERLGSNRNAVYKLAFDARRALQGALRAAGIDGDEIAWAFGDDEEDA
jgi:RNA polymerase sigma-70 factor, ECF subfamily